MAGSRPAPVLIALFLILAAGSTCAAQAAGERVVLRPEATSPAPGIRLTDSSETTCTIVFDLPYLLSETVLADGHEYRSLTIPDGAIAGEIGAPAVPTYGGLLAVPNGRAVRAEVVRRDRRTLEGIRLLPVQTPEGPDPVIEPGDDKFASPARSTVIVGAPAVLHGRRVVPFTILPVSCDPASATVEVDALLEIEFTFVGSDTRNDARRTPAELPASFFDLLAERLVNPGPPATEKTGAAEGPGTYLVVCPDDAGVVSALQPLIDWRRRQGYAVQVATTAETGSSTTSIKSHIQGVYDTATPPLEFVVLVGDHNGDVAIPTWFETISSYGGEGDHYYSELEGDDVLADVFIGRLSCRSASELTAIVEKVVDYETAPPLADTSWYTRAALAADPSASGETTIYVSQWLKAQLEAIAFTQVDTIWSGYYSNLMLASINQGLSIFSYRGYLGMSGFTSGHAASATNGGMLPFAVIPTCDSGSFASATSARNEAFLRNPNGGAIGAIGLATIGTHTRYNNALYHGIGETVINGDDHRMGVAQAGGKLEVYRNYQNFEPEEVEIWSVWSSLIGDPATDVWLSVPRTLTVDHPAALPTGAGAVPVSVTADGSPVDGAVVAVTKDGEISRTARTGPDGQALLSLPAHTSGSLLITVYGHGLLPYRGSATLGTVDLFVDLAQAAVDDDDTGGSQGNGDAVVNPAETLQLTCEVLNRGTQLAGAVTAVLTSDDPYVTVVDGADDFGDLAGGTATWGSSEFVIEVAPTAPAGHVLALTFTATSGAASWTSALELPVIAPDLAVNQTTWSLGSPLEPGQNGSLTLQLANDGGIAASGATGTLTTESPWITITDATGAFGDIAPAAAADNAADPFALDIAADCFAGHLAAFVLTVTDAGGAVQNLEFNLPVGSVSSTDPVGPDAYGYYALDDTDTDSLLAPTYAWVEIDPNHGGAGTTAGLGDFGYEQDDTAKLQLPFTFTYYGQDYTSIAVCSNGWIAMSNTSLRHWRNWSIPSAGSPDAMIAPFWDDLEQQGGNQVYWWHDTASHRFVVQWSRMENAHGGVQNFEVILHDPLAYPTPTGDGEILFQYETVENNDTSRGYATVGIQDLAGTDGVLYTYYDQYAPGAAPLAAGRAILFRPYGPDLAATCEAAPGNVTVTLGPDRQETEFLSIANNGEAGSVLRYLIDKIDPLPLGAGETADKNLAGSTLVADVAEYTAGETIDLELTASCVSDDLEWIVEIELDLPDGVVLNSASAFSNSSLDFLGSLGDGALARWGSGHLADNRSGSATLNVTFATVGGPVEIPFTLTGDEWGTTPHRIDGSIVLNPSGPSILVQSPDGGEFWAEGETRDIEFLVSGGPETVVIELDRNDDGGWQTLAADVPAGDGVHAWTVTRPLGDQCRIRVSDSADPGVFDVSDNVFTIGRNLGWVTVGPYTGFVAAGTSEDIQLDFDTTGLAEGTYRADLEIANTAGSILTVPITLTVGGPTPVDETPAILSLGRNYPNPFNPRTNLGFSLPTATSVELAVYDARGRLVKVLHHGDLAAGPHTMVWDGTDTGGRTVATGTYFCRLVAGDRVLHRKMLLMK